MTRAAPYAPPAPARLRGPLLVYDGACAFCRRWASRLRRLTGERVSYAPYQEAAPRLPQVPYWEFVRSIQLLEPGGRRYSGAAAAFRTLSHAPGLGWTYWLYRGLPGFAPAAERLYKLVSRHRHQL